MYNERYISQWTNFLRNTAIVWIKFKYIEALPNWLWLFLQNELFSQINTRIALILMLDNPCIKSNQKIVFFSNLTIFCVNWPFVLLILDLIHFFTTLSPHEIIICGNFMERSQSKTHEKPLTIFNRINFKFFAHEVQTYSKNGDESEKK